MGIGGAFELPNIAREIPGPIMVPRTPAAVMMRPLVWGLIGGLGAGVGVEAVGG